MTDAPAHIMIIGASGVFGSRLVQLMQKEPGWRVTLVGRRTAPLERLAAGHDGYSVRALDRNLICADDLAGVDLVIDASGPFQNSHSAVIDAAIDARCHYADLADGRDFVGAIGRFDVRAKAANIAVITGASSVPALSHAVLDHLTAGWREVEAIQVGIYPGNRAPRGRAVVEAILSYSGKPVRVFRDGRWQQLPGWGMLHRADIAGVGKRWASICDTPDQDLLVARYAPTKSAEFFAGLELPILHLGLWGLSLPVRWGLIPSLRPAAGIMLWMAQRFLRFGSDKGAMEVVVSGTDAAGQRARRRWTLAADANRGPFTPTLAALALARRLRDGRFDFRGAMPCAGMLSLAEFDRDFDALDMQRRIDSLPPAS
ncbi:saccharopine dehydrogenase family protein [Sphingorhabdus arenilitoris]|uniref:Saccharopine dehydrogenase family protein n=1 Tax=Sphingorhabdus arenilitoris TaxID=1490041 RepID=A0ABV8RCA7_9SPHN